MTHCERVLDLLSDGKPHSHMEGYRLGVMLHSRVADLRRQGHAIRCWREGKHYVYQLDSLTEGGRQGSSLVPVQPGEKPPPSVSESGPVGPTARRADIDGSLNPQLQIEEAT